MHWLFPQSRVAERVAGRPREGRGLATGRTSAPRGAHCSRLPAFLWRCGSRLLVAFEGLISCGAFRQPAPDTQQVSSESVAAVTPIVPSPGKPLAPQPFSHITAGGEDPALFPFNISSCVNRTQGRHGTKVAGHHAERTLPRPSSPSPDGGPVKSLHCVALVG